MKQDLFFIDDTEGTSDALVTQQTIIDTEERLGSLLDFMPTGLIIHQKQGILYANQKALSLLNCNKHTIVGKHFLDFVCDELREIHVQKFHESFETLNPVKFPEIALHIPDIETRYLQVTARALAWEGTEVIQIVLEDVSELRKQTQELQNLTYHDGLTGAYNRRFFIQHAEKAIKHAIDEQEPFGLLIFDLDWFKQINDTFGHLAGDEALKNVVTIWNKNTRHNNKKDRGNDAILSRIGGEEFAVCLTNIDLKQVHLIAERIRKAMEQSYIHLDDVSFNVTGSFGGTMLNHHDRTIDDLIRRADIALYRAKAKGRNRVEFE